MLAHCNKIVNRTLYLHLWNDKCANFISDSTGDNSCRKLMQH